MAGNTEQAEPTSFDLGSVFRGGAGVSALASSVPAVPAARDIEIAPDKVLDVASIIEDQAEELQRKLAEHLGALRIQPPSEDTVSTHAVQAWNQVVAGGEGSYERRVRAYVQGLRDLAGQLREASKRYQLSEQEKAEAFGDRRVHEA
ncbi:hypothetical protein [Prauserella muralis]|uniref:hypothetical protein n=1 Tax=Prauserella muralis TaxID=588067 RepID=UPI000DD4C421|nr:hypothetical protein [Prauserella muralis]TWE14180.1 hypothetical protein FHX69_6318 [Prauserella muralis]